jgi:glycosyltransferase involved in cell wall biosynthesis
LKVCYFNYLYDEHGAAIHVREFARAFKKLGNAISVHFIGKPELRNDRSNNLYKNDLRIKSRKFLAKYLHQFHVLFLNLKFFIREYKIISRRKPDLILTRFESLHFSTIIISRIKKIPIVAEVNSPLALEARQFIKQYYFLPHIIEIFEKLILRFSNAVFTVSSEAKQELMKYKIPAGKIKVIPNGVDIEKFNPSIAKASISNLTNSNDKIVIGYSGCFAPWHSINDLEFLTNYLTRQYDNLYFLFIGGGYNKATFEEKIKNNLKLKNKVYFTGKVTHELMPGYLALMDIVIAPYPNIKNFYGSPLKIFEYMAAGKAIIATGIGQITSLIQDGKNGFLYSPENQNELIQKIEALIQSESLRKSYGQKARETIANNFTWHHNAIRVHKICQHVLKSYH